MEAFHYAVIATLEPNAKLLKFRGDITFSANRHNNSEPGKLVYGCQEVERSTNGRNRHLSTYIAVNNFTRSNAANVF